MIKRLDRLVADQGVYLRFLGGAEGIRTPDPLDANCVSWSRVGVAVLVERRWRRIDSGAGLSRLLYLLLYRPLCVRWSTVNTALTARRRASALGGRARAVPGRDMTLLLTHCCKVGAVAEGDIHR
jgi:hypothetical protein